MERVVDVPTGVRSTLQKISARSATTTRSPSFAIVAKCCDTSLTLTYGRPKRRIVPNVWCLRHIAWARVTRILFPQHFARDCINRQFSNNRLIHSHSNCDRARNFTVVVGFDKPEVAIETRGRVRHDAHTIDLPRPRNEICVRGSPRSKSSRVDHQ